MTERETIDTLIAVSKKDSSYLAAFEALGKTIEDLKSELRTKDYIISELKGKLKETEERLKEW